MSSNRRRSRAAFVVAGLAVLALAFSSSAQAAKKVAVAIPPTSGPGEGGGQFSSPLDIAVNDPTVDDGTGADGFFYVADKGNNRVQAFDEDGDFQFAIGRDVVKPDGVENVAVNEEQTIAVDASGGTFALRVPNELGPGVPHLVHETIGVVATGGTFTVRVGPDRTPPIAYNASAAAVDAALEATGAIGAGGVTVAGPNGGPWDIEFAEPPPGVDPDPDGLTGESALLLLYRGQLTAPLPYDATAAEVESALAATAAIAGNVDVTGSDGGPWTVEFGGAHSDTDVKALVSDPSNLTGGAETATVTTTLRGTSFEICTVAEDCKKGLDNGDFGDIDSPQGIAVDQDTGDFYVAGRDDHHLQQFSADGEWVRSFGAGVVRSGGLNNVPTNEKQVVALDPGIPSGSFVLSFKGLAEEAASVSGGAGEETTVDIPHNASAATVQAALAGLSTIGPGDVAVSGTAGGPWTVEFTGAYTDVNVPMLGPGFGKGQSFPFGFRRISTAIEGGGSFEICTAAADCLAGAATAIAGGVSFGGGLDSINAAALAVSPLNGHLFVVEPPNDRISEFDPRAGTLAGTFVRSVGWGVDTGADSFEVCTAASGCQASRPFSAHRGKPGFFRNTIDVSVDSTGVLYVNHAATSPNAIDRFDTSIAGGPEVAGELALDQIPALPAPLTVDPDTDGGGSDFDRLLARCNVAPEDGYACSEESVSIDAIEEYDLRDDPPALLDTHLIDAGLFTDVSLGTSSRIASNQAAGKIYLSSQNLGAHRIYILDETGATGAPIITIEEPSNVTARGADVIGEVNPDGFPATVRFQLSVDGGSTWFDASPPQNVDGTSPAPISVELTDLEANRSHQVRILVVRAFGNGSFASESKSFVTGALPPDAETFYPRHRGAETAQFTGRLNPNNLPTEYYFEYGSGPGYEATVPVPANSATGGAGRTVIQAVTGLTPGTEYHYRLVAFNSEGEARGDDISFVTRAAVHDQGARGYEMVTPPFKVVRSAVSPGNAPRYNPNVGMPSLDGERLAWNISFFPLTDEVGAAGTGDRRIISRTPTGWTVGPALVSLHPLGGSPVQSGRQDALASSGDFGTLTWSNSGGVAELGGAILPTEGAISNRLYTRREGTGIRGFTPWLTNPEKQALEQGFSVGDTGNIPNAHHDNALFNDAGTAMVRWGHYRGLAEVPEAGGDDDPSDDFQLSGSEGGSTVYVQRTASPDLLPSSTKDLVNECTGAGANRTQLPTRLGSGIASDTIGLRPCGEGEVTSRRGAAVGGEMKATALTDDGNRVFFQSPDPEALVGGGGVLPTCDFGTGSETSCPPQLFVRQYLGEEPVVRWISHSRSTPIAGNAFGGSPIASQRIAEMGAGVSFQGASRDGRFVYFKTNAPLVPTDPDGGSSVTGDSASSNSWDLYRYELPSDLGSDPAGGTLERISGGPSGNADPSTNEASGSGAPLRFHSDDGSRAYFVTTSAIAGADSTPPNGGVTGPGGTVGGGGGMRNLYLFDDKATGSERYRFIARIPFSAAPSSDTESALNACASWSAGYDYQLTASSTRTDGVEQLNANCFRGTPDGSTVIFFTRGQLTVDDTDEAGDIYLYDVASDELTRVTAPPPGAASYSCNRGGNTVIGLINKGQCNGDLGTRGTWGGGGTNAGGDLEYARGWGAARYYNVAEDADGVVSVFFESKTSLVPEDTNGDYYDVYEWRAGELKLISPGSSEADAWFSGSSRDGRDVFFYTSQRIDPRELDDADYDIYDARIGGGFPYVAPPAPCDVLDLACEVDAVDPPSVGTVSTGSSGGAGNVRPRGSRCGKGKLRRGKRCLSKAALARKRCRKLKGRAQRRCVRRRTSRPRHKQGKRSGPTMRGGHDRRDR